MGTELSIIIQEHNEGREFVTKMLDQVDALDIDKEVQLVTSLPYDKFLLNYNISLKDYDFPVYVSGNIQSCGGARNTGGALSNGDMLLYVDCHTCFNNNGVGRLLDTLERHEDAIVAPAIQPVEFPDCTPSGGLGHGVAFRFVANPFEWVWIPHTVTDSEFAVPFVCGCAFSMTRQTSKKLQQYGGFLDAHTGLSWEEEKSMRLARLGHPTFIEPRAVVGHYFKGYEGHKQWDEHSVKDNLLSKVIGFYINVFNPVLWNYIDNMLKDKWGYEYTKAMNLAVERYGWLRRKLEPYADSIDENWYLRRN